MRAGVSRDMPVYFPSFRRYSFQPATEGGLRLSRPGCLVLVKVVIIRSSLVVFVTVSYFGYNDGYNWYQTTMPNVQQNKCIGDVTKAAARQSLNCIKNQKKTKYGENDFQYAGWNSYTLQCDTWLWDDMPLNSPRRPPYWNSTSGFHFHTSPQSTCHSVPVCEILSKSDHPRQKKMDVISIFKMADLSHLIL